jgi:calcineurin-like phosphoesterase
MRLLFLGDIVGRSGRDAVVAALPALRRDLMLDLVVVNAEKRLARLRPGARHGAPRCSRPGRMC